MLKKLKNLVFFYKWPLLSGVMIGTTFIPFPPWALLFGFVPLWYFWLTSTKCLKHILISGFITQFTLTLIGFNWVAHTLNEFGHLPLPIAYLALMGFCCFANLHVAAAGGVWAILCKKFDLTTTGKILLLPLLTALAEMNFPMIFDWHFGYTWYWGGLPGIQTAELWGAKFLSVFSIFLNALLLLAIVHIANRKKAFLLVTTTLVLFTSVNLLGVYLKNRLPEPDKSVNVLIVQANIGNLEKQYAEKGLGFRDHIANTYFKLTKKGYSEALEQPDFAVWPETAFPVRLNPSGVNGGLGLRLRRFLKENQINLFTGSYGVTHDEAGVSNSLFYFNDQGEMQSPIYSKTTLLVFGEYIPGGQWFPVLYKLLPEVGRFSRGQGPVIQTLNDLKVGPQICYEGLFDWFSRDLARLGSDIIVNVTNDSWYGTWQQPYQHLYMTLSRAIEVRRPLVRSTNTGISTVVLANGDVLTQSPLHEKWQHTYKVPYNSSAKLTLFSRWGYWSSWIFLFLLGVVIIGIQRSRAT